MCACTEYCPEKYENYIKPERENKSTHKNTTPVSAGQCCGIDINDYFAGRHV